MSDLVLAILWTGALAGGLITVVLARGLGVPTTYVRDLLHVGAGVWILGWPSWHGHAWPIAIVVAVAIAIAVMPALARSRPAARRLVASVSDDDERWSGLVLYTLSFAALTAIGLTRDPLPAAAALLALALGDGVGGAIGRRFGRLGYRAPGGKRKTIEGSLVVALGAAAGGLIAARVLARGLPVATAIGLGAVAAIAEALAPRGTDNAIVPAAVWLAAEGAS
jgi:dolichol kinase